MKIVSGSDNRCGGWLEKEQVRDRYSAEQGMDGKINFKLSKIKHRNSKYIIEFWYDTKELSQSMYADLILAYFQIVHHGSHKGKYCLEIRRQGWQERIFYGWRRRGGEERGAGWQVAFNYYIQTALECHLSVGIQNIAVPIFHFKEINFSQRHCVCFLCFAD